MSKLRKSDKRLGRHKPERRPWSDLPDLPLFSVSNRLQGLRDFFAFRGVCRAWRSISKTSEKEYLESRPPLLWSKNDFGFYCLMEKAFHRCLRVLPDRTHFIVNSSLGYLIMADRDVSRKPFLVNPFTGAGIRAFPTAPHTIEWAILSSPPTSSDCVLLASDSSIIQYCRPGDSQWTVCKFPGFGQQLPMIRHATLFKGRVYAHAYTRDILTFELVPCPEVIRLEEPCRKPYMFAVSGEELFAVRPLWVSHELVSFVVYQLDLSRNKWVRVENLGGRSLFVDLNWTSADNPKKWRGGGNCIYFYFRYSSDVYSIKRYSGDVNSKKRYSGDVNSIKRYSGDVKFGVFHMEDGKIEFVEDSSASLLPFRYSMWVLPSLGY